MYCSSILNVFINVYFDGVICTLILLGVNTCNGRKSVFNVNLFYLGFFQRGVNISISLTC